MSPDRYRRRVLTPRRLAVAAGITFLSLAGCDSSNENAQPTIASTAIAQETAPAQTTAIPVTPPIPEETAVATTIPSAEATIPQAETMAADNTTPTLEGCPPGKFCRPRVTPTVECPQNLECFDQPITDTTVTPSQPEIITPAQETATPAESITAAETVTSSTAAPAETNEPSQTTEAQTTSPTPPTEVIPEPVELNGSAIQPCNEDQTIVTNNITTAKGINENQTQDEVANTGIVIYYACPKGTTLEVSGNASVFVLKGFASVQQVAPIIEQQLQSGCGSSCSGGVEYFQYGQTRKAGTIKPVLQGITRENIASQIEALPSTP